ncbi:MAG TPA: ATP-grasp domain-containing protein [Catalimonadaceae bacterium]|nr:ATP-grasp domain-containing protein [Catalimonadaceae bacterium]HPI09918.1 ATP-grasp domain-containing protein [Catalimonadaceae bacterium]
MEKKTILVTGIGGNVGQGIIRNLRFSGLDFRIVGTNSAPFSAGNYLVDKFYPVSFAYEPGYLQEVTDIVEKENVDLIIPSTDFEVYFLSHAARNFPCLIATSGPFASENYLDKFLTWKHHSKSGIPFANSILPSEYKSDFASALAKPRKGRGSRGIMKNNFDASKLTDDEYMIQELHEGKEITTAVYVSYLTGELKGLINMERSLDNGTTNFCKVNFEFDTELTQMAEKMIRHSDLRGSFNIQSIVTNNGDIIPFEINCRISGTNSIRTHFGFKDVEYTVRELLFSEAIQKPAIVPGVAQRILLDVIYPGCTNESQLNKDATDHFIVF